MSWSPEPEEVRRALGAAFGILARRDHSEAELTVKLARKGIGSETIDAALTRLRQDGYLDDRRFARRLAESAVTGGRGYGPRIRFDLRRKGIPDEIIANVMAEIATAHDESATLAALVATKFPRFDPTAANDREKQRIMNQLLRRGFSAGIVYNFFRNARYGDESRNR